MYNGTNYNQLGQILKFTNTKNVKYTSYNYINYIIFKKYKIEYVEQRAYITNKICLIK